MDGSAGVGNGHPALGGVHRRKHTKKTKQSNKRNKPIKVVYISNPMKVQTSASKFMALVQQLTGQDADFPDPSKFQSSAAVCAGASPYLLDNPAFAGDDDGNLTMNNDSPSSLGAELPAEDDFLGIFYDDFDDLIFPPPVIGNFSGILPAAAVTCESYPR